MLGTFCCGLSAGAVHFLLVMSVCCRNLPSAVDDGDLDLFGGIYGDGGWQDRRHECAPLREPYPFQPSPRVCPLRRRSFDFGFALLHLSLLYTVLTRGLFALYLCGSREVRSVSLWKCEEGHKNGGRSQAGGAARPSQDSWPVFRDEDQCSGPPPPARMFSISLVFVVQFLVWSICFLLISDSLLRCR